MLTIDLNNKRPTVKVLYIAGEGRSGSTIIGDTLGHVEGFTHVGELLELWSILLNGIVRCGCGAPVAACEIWRDVLRESYGQVDASFFAHMLRFRNSRARDLACLQAITSGPIQSHRQREALAELTRLYRAIKNVFRCKVIIDSSKHPMYAYLLDSIVGIEPYVVHLTRDPRASAFSFLSKKVAHGKLLWARDTAPFSASLKWNYKHTTLDLLSKRFRNRALHIRYEDFVARPEESLRRMLVFIGEAQAPLPLQRDRTLNLAIQHTVSGNPSRFVRGKVRLRENRSWQTQLRRRDRVLVTAMTWPLLMKYGYPIRVGVKQRAEQAHTIADDARASGVGPTT
jgi:hypothetical protein